jgi:hypothetical protein
MPEERLLKPVAGGLGSEDHQNLITASAKFHMRSKTLQDIHLHVIHRIFSTDDTALSCSSHLFLYIVLMMINLLTN